VAADISAARLVPATGVSLGSVFEAELDGGKHRDNNHQTCLPTCLY
jgi:hypothetical protein